MRSPRPIDGARTWQGEVSFLLSDPGYPDTVEIFVRTNHHHDHHDNQTTPTPTPSLPDASAAEPPISTLPVPSLAWSQALSCHGLYIVQYIARTILVTTCTILVTVLYPGACVVHCPLYGTERHTNVVNLTKS